MIKKRCIKCQIEGPVVEGRNVYIGCQSCGCSDVIFFGTEEIIVKCTLCGEELSVLPEEVFHSVHKCGGTSWIVNPGKSTSYVAPPIVDQVLQDRAKEQVIEGVSGIVVCHNEFKLTEKCIGLLKSTICNQIILVDNGSTDETEEWARRELGIVYIRNQINLGCGIARNQGAKWATGDYLFFIDNDQFVPSDIVSRMLAFSKDMVGTNLWKVRADGDSFPVDFDAVQSVENDMYVGSGGMLIKKSVFVSLKGFDERFAPAWYEDTDFCFRAKKEGYSVHYLHDSGIEHLGNKTIKMQETFSSEQVKKASHNLFLEIWGEFLRSDNGEFKRRKTKGSISDEITSKKKAARNLKDIEKILDDLHITFWLDCGTLLGAYRDRDFCEDDEDDIDLGTWDEYRIYIPKIIERAEEKGFKLYHQWNFNGTGHEVALEKDGCKIDLYFNMKDKEEEVAYCYFYKQNKPFKKVVVPLKFYEHLVPIKFLGNSFLRPKDIEEYLELRYGDWKTKVSRKDYNCYTANENQFLVDMEIEK